MDEISQIHNKARQLEAAAKVANDREAIMMTTEIVVRAERRLGQLLETAPKNNGSRGVGKSGVPSKHPTLTELGIDKKLSSRARKLAKVDEQAFEAAVSVAREVASQITASVILRQRQRPPDDDVENAPVVIPPDRKKSEDMLLFELSDALATIAKCPIPPQEIYGKVRDFQRHRFANPLDAAIDFLNTLRKHWR